MMSPAPEPAAHQTTAPLSLVWLNWLIPGAGFAARGRWARAGAQFGLVMGTVLLGALMHGGVTWPAWSLQSPEFNLINNITFVVQIGSGAPALASLGGHLAGWEWLGGDPPHALFELGSYYLVVAGAINYFGCMNFYDRLVKPAARFSDSRAKANSEGEKA